MILLYTSLIVLLATAKFLISRRAKSLEKKFARVAKEADNLVKQPLFKDGNSSRIDPYASAKRQYLLGHLTQKRDRLEAKYSAWNQRAERFGRYLSNVRSWQGKKLPYTFGVVDVVCVLGLLDYLGFREYVNVRALFDLIKSRFTG
jgi:hypothetical protein